MPVFGANTLAASGEVARIRWLPSLPSMPPSASNTRSLYPLGASKRRAGSGIAGIALQSTTPGGGDPVSAVSAVSVVGPVVFGPSGLGVVSSTMPPLQAAKARQRIAVGEAGEACMAAAYCPGPGVDGSLSVGCAIGGRSNRRSTSGRCGSRYPGA